MAQPEQPKQQLCGGTTSGRDPTDEEKMIAIQFKNEALANLKIEKSEKFDVKRVMTQVVAGTNYFFRVDLDDQKSIDLRVYRHFSGTTSLHSSRAVGESMEFSYF